MSKPNPTTNNNKANHNNSNNNMDKTVARTAGFIVFSGIAISILKAINPYNNSSTKQQQQQQPTPSPPSPPPPQRPTLQQPIIKEPKLIMDSQVPALKDTPSFGSSSRSVVIAKGDTLWGLSQKYGVSIDAIKEANGLTGNTIYAGKKLVIPSL